MRRKTQAAGISWILTSVFAIGIVTAQGDACPALVEQALSAVGDNCGLMERNSACYGYNRVDSTFTQVMADDFFSAPAQRAGLTDLQTISTAPMQADIAEWGVAVMSVQANIPNTLPGQAVKMLLIGEGTVENAVPPQEAQIVEGKPIEISINTNANIRSGPGTNANVVGGAVFGDVFLTDAMSLDYSWLRIAYNDAPAWVNRSVVNGTGLDALPRIGTDRLSPMQSFIFQTGGAEVGCVGEPPPTLLVQGPQRVTVSLSANGANFTLGSTAVFRQPAPGVMQLIVIDGNVRVGSGTVIPGGFMVEMQVNPETGASRGGWTNFRAIPPEILETLNFLERVPPQLLNYPVDVPTQNEIAATQARIRAANSQANQGNQPEATAEGTAEGTREPGLEVTLEVTVEVPVGEVYIYMEAQPPLITEGECTTIFWNTRNIKEVWFEGVMNIGTNSVQRCPVVDTLYTIEIFLLDGTVQTRTVEVQVLPLQTDTPPLTIATEIPS